LRLTRLRCRNSRHYPDRAYHRNGNYEDTAPHPLVPMSTLHRLESTSETCGPQHRVWAQEAISKLFPATCVKGGHELSSYEAVRWLRHDSFHLIENPKLLVGWASDDGGHRLWDSPQGKCSILPSRRIVARMDSRSVPSPLSQIGLSPGDDCVHGR
jgi:hypothetical protein